MTDLSPELKVITDPPDFRSRMIASLGTPGLREKYVKNASGGHASRTKAAAEVPEWEDLRERARQIKLHCLDHLDQYLEQFADNVERNGGHVFWAVTAADARAYILDLAHRNGVKQVVKAKSMASEEIHLNSALEEAGIEPVETDLGEFIVQLARELPSHIVTPAIHKSRQDIAKLFHDELGIDYTEDAQAMTGVARRVLRERFLAATMGFSGANFAVAETGTIILIENEGNIRLCTTLPRIHVVLVGIEKLLPKMRDLSVFLRLLARSGTGQRLSCYTSMITGPRREDDVDGPEELHVILLDNGRSKVLGEAHKRPILSCIRCGACLNACPVFRNVGGHAYGSVYPGPIGKLLGPHSIGTDRGHDLPFGSSLCGYCSAVCPVKIDIAHLLLQLRNEEHTIGKTDWKEQFGFKVWSLVAGDASWYRPAAKMARLAKGVWDRTFGENRLPAPLSEWTKTRALPQLAAQSFAEWWQETNGGNKHE